MCIHLTNKVCKLCMQPTVYDLCLMTIMGEILENNDSLAVKMIVINMF